MSSAMQVPKIKIAWFLSPELADLYAEYDQVCQTKLSRCHGSMKAWTWLTLPLDTARTTSVRCI